DKEIEDDLGVVVPEVEAASGMKCANVHGIGVKEAGQRQHRSKRLVEMDDIEALFLQEGPDLVEDKRRERDACGRAIGWDRNRRPELIDVAIVLLACF